MHCQGAYKRSLKSDHDPATFTAGFPMKEFLGYAAMLTGTVAAIMVSANIGRRITGYGFVIFTASSLTWIAYALQGGEAPLMLQNAVLTAINVAGIYRWLIARKKPSQ